MRTERNRRRHRRHDDMGRGHTDHFMQQEYPGEFAHRYSENMHGDPRSNRYENQRSADWEQNPGAGSYGYNYYGGDHNRTAGDDSDRQRRDFRAHNTRFREHMRRYRRRRGYNFDLERENLFREYGSVDEHLNQAVPGARYDW